MVKEYNKFLTKTKLILGVIIALAAVITILFNAYNHFAKEEQVNEKIVEVKKEVEKNDSLIVERLDLSIIQQQISQEEEKRHNIRQEQRYELREVPRELTEIEKEALEEAEKNIKKLEEKEKESLKRYEELKKNRIDNENN